MWDGINRRRFPRVNFPCYIRVCKKKSHREFLTQTENISCGGIAVVLEENLGLFEEVELKMDLKDSNPLVECGGMVVWVVKRTNPHEPKSAAIDTGIEFANLKQTDRVRIDAIVKRLTKQE